MRLGSHHTKEAKEKNRVTHLGKKQSEETKIKRGIYEGHPHSKKTKQILRERNLGKNNPFYKKTHTKENLDIISKTSKERWKNKEYKNKLRKAISKANKNNPKLIEALKRNWRNPEFKEKTIKAQIKGLMKRPTSFEQKISNLCFRYNLPFIYTGDGRFLINYKNPDFVNHKERIVIEVFYSYFKIRSYGSVENYKEVCRRKYESLGWKVIFIDELDLSHKNWEEVCLNKIQRVR